MTESFRPPSPSEFAARAPAGDIPARAAPTGDAPPPRTGDPAVDTVLADLAALERADLDGMLAAGESVHATLTSRLSDLGS